MLRQSFTGCKTIGEIIRQAKLASLERLRPALPPELQELASPRTLRYWEEWPDWVLRVAAEVFHVDVPTISKAEILETLRFVNFFVFVARIDGGPSPTLLKFPDPNPRTFGALVGHGVAMMMDLRQLFEEARGRIPEARLEEFRKRASLEDFQCEIAPLVADYFKAEPTAFMAFQAGFSDAERNTFGKGGTRKETPLTPVYRKILDDWPEIEGLSGPKALTEYLSPLLGNQDFEDKYERVKAICKRMRITFKPFVKGR